MKKLFFSLALILAFTASVCATPVTVSNSTQTNFNPSNLSGDVTVSVTATSGSTTVTSSALFRAAWVNLGGFRVSIGGTAYTVANVDSTSSLSLTSAFTGITGATTLTLYKYVEVRFYSNISFRPLGSSEVIQVGTPGSGSWFKRFAASVSSTLNGAVNTSGTAVTWVSGDLFSSAMVGKVVAINGTNYVISSVASSTSLTLSSSAGTQSAVAFTCNTGTSFLFIPSFTIESTTDSVDNNTARYKIGFYRPDNSLIQYYICSSGSELRIPPTTPTTLADICIYNSTQVINIDNTAYTKGQIDARFPSCTSGQMIYYAATGQAQNCLTVGTGLAIAGGTITATGGGGGGVTGTGATNYIPIWTSSTAIGASQMFYDAGNTRFQSQKNILIFTTNTSSSLLIDSDQIVLEGSGTRTVGTHMQMMKAVASQTGQYLRFLDSSNVLKFAVDADGDMYPRGVTTDWPSANATGALFNNGSGTLSWTAAPSGSGTANTLATWSSSTALTSTALGIHFAISGGTFQARRVKEAINVKMDYGADPTGSTNSISALNAAVTAAVAGDTIYIPTGNYRIDSTWTINKQVRIVGDGVGSAITCNMGTGSDCVVINNGVTFIDGIELEGFAVLGTTNASRNGLVLRNLSRITTKNVYVATGTLASTGVGVSLEGVLISKLQFLVTNSFIYPYTYASPANGILMVGSSVQPSNANTFDNCVVEISGGYGLKIDGSVGTAGTFNNWIIGGTFEGAVDPGIWVKNASYGSIENVHVEDTVAPLFVGATVKLENVDNWYVGNGFSATALNLLNSRDNRINGITVDSITEDATSKRNHYGLVLYGINGGSNTFSSSERATSDGQMIDASRGDASRNLPARHTSYNLLRNGNIELWATSTDATNVGTSSGTLTQTGTGLGDTNKLFGTYAAKVSGGTTNVLFPVHSPDRDTIIAAPATIVTASAWVRIASGQATQPNVSIQIWLNSGATVNTVPGITDTAGVWTYVTISSPIPSGTTAVDVVFTNNAAAAAGIYYVDGVSLLVGRAPHMTFAEHLPTGLYQDLASANQNITRIKANASVGASGANFIWPSATPASLSYLQMDTTGTMLATPLTGGTNAVQVGSSGTLAGSASLVYDSGTTTLSIGTSSSANGIIGFRNATNANITSLRAGAAGSSFTLILPTALPGSAGCLQVDNVGAITQTGSACGTGGSIGGSSGNIQWNNGGAFAGMAGSTVTTLGYLTSAPTVSTSGSPTFLTYTGPAHTTLAADTEATDINFNLARTVQFTAGGGAFNTQRAVRFQAPTYAFTSADTITNSCTVCISGAPVAGTNATLTSKYSLWVETGTSNFDDPVSIGAGSSAASDDYLLFPFTGGSNSSGPAIRWGSSASYASQSSIFLSNGFTFQGANSTHDPVKIRTGTGTSSDGTLVFEFRPGDGIFNFTPSSGVTSSRHELEVVDVTSTGTPAAGFGGQITYKGESSTTNTQQMGSFNWSWTDATHATRTAKVFVQTVYNAGSLTENWGVQANQNYGAAEFDNGNKSGSFTIDWNAGNNQKLVATGNLSTITFSNIKAGARYVLVISQDATGGRTWTPPTLFKMPGGVAGNVLTGTVNAKDVFDCISSDGSNLYCNGLFDVKNP